MIPAIKIKMHYTKTLRPNKKMHLSVCADDCQINLFSGQTNDVVRKDRTVKLFSNHKLFVHTFIQNSI